MKLTYDEIEKHVNQKKHCIDLSHCDTSDDDIILVTCYLNNKPGITSLILDNFCRQCNFGLKSFKTLAANVTLTMLDLSYNYIELEGAKALATNTTIKNLYLRNCYIKDEGAKALAANSTLKMLNLTSNSFGDDGVKALAANTSITTLSISGNNITIEGCKALARNATITTLYIRWSEIGVEGAKVLANNTGLKSLDVTGNGIGDEGTKALASNNSLTTLNVSVNKISLDAAIALTKNTSITNLDIRNITIDNEGVKEIVNALKHNITLVKLSHGFDKKCFKETIEKILARNKIMPWMFTIKYVRLMAQAQRSENCPLGTLPTEVLGIINNFLVGTNHYSFFINQFDKRPTAIDIIAARNMAMA